MKFCESCGHELHGEKFCVSCGKEVSAVAEHQPDEVQNVTIQVQKTADHNKGSVIVKKLSSIAPQKLLIIAGVAIVVIIAIIVIITANAGPNFQKLYDEYCSYPWAEVGSDESYLTIDTNPYDEDDNGMAYPTAYSAIQDVNEALGLPASLLEDMGATSGSDGRQVQEFDKVTVSWKYHPDTGLEVIYKKK